MRNFRSLRAIDVLLDEQTVLLGPNNAGKSAFLLALHGAIGAGVRQTVPEDVFLDVGERAPPRSRSILVDVLVVPVDPAGARQEHFQEGSVWGELWGTNIQQADDDSEFLAIRHRYAWDPVKGEYVSQRVFLKSWPVDSGDLEKVKVVGAQALGRQLAPLSLHTIGAARDIASDMGGRGSLWDRLVSDPGLPEADVKAIEQQLDAINSAIITGSDVLRHLQEHLKNLSSTVSCAADNVSITPIARHLSDLRRGVDVILGSDDAPALPVSCQGMGTRSLATILLLKAYMIWRIQRHEAEALHSFVAVEEPETHLQPQAQRSLINQMAGIPGQRIITTHSPYVASQVGVHSFRHFSKRGAETVVSSLVGTELGPEDLRKLDRRVLRTKGEILFARGIVLFEGETEEQAIPSFATAHWGMPDEATGLVFVGVGGDNGYLPFLRLAKSFGIPWWVLGDGEPNAIAALDKALAAVEEDPAASNVRVFLLPGGSCFESYMAGCGYEDVIVEMIIAVRAQNDQHAEALRQEWADKEDRQAEIVAVLKANKTMYGALIGRTISSLPDPSRRVPPRVMDMFNVVESVVPVKAVAEGGSK